MYLSNITFAVSNQHVEYFEIFLKKEIMIFMKGNGLNNEIQTFKLLDKVDENSSNYSFQIFFDTMKDFEDFQAEIFPEILRQIEILFSGHYGYFQTLLQKF